MAKRHPRDIVTLPNTRKFFIPDPGWMLIDADLRGADAMVVAREAQDNEMLDDLFSGTDLHSKNAAALFGTAFTALAAGPERNALRQATKQAVHATNYGCSPRTLATILGWTIRRAEDFQASWFRLHPGIRAWQRRVEAEITQTRTVRNAYGYRIIYFDRIESLLGQALAWVPQSTVAETCFQGALRVEAGGFAAQMLLQVHDSIVFQIPKSLFSNETMSAIAALLQNPIPYDPPLVIPWKLSYSEKSWGDLTTWLPETSKIGSKPTPITLETPKVLLPSTSGLASPPSPPSFGGAYG